MSDETLNDHRARVTELHERLCERTKATPTERLSHNTRQAAVFDEGASFFASADATPADVVPRLEAIAAATQLSKDDRVLDVGVGTGALLAFYEARGVRQSDITGVDLAENMLAVAAERYPEARFVRGDVVDLPTTNEEFVGSFDAVTFNACFGNLWDQPAAVYAAEAMLKSGGRVVVSHPLGAAFVDELHDKDPTVVPHGLPSRASLEAWCDGTSLRVASYTSTESLYIAVLERAGSGADTSLSRRAVGSSAAAAALAAALPRPPPAEAALASAPLAIQQLTRDEIDALLAKARSDGGKLLPSGVRVVDLVVGDGPRPSKGARVWVAFKVWANGFDAGQVADLSFLDGKPYDYALGAPTDRIPAGVDEGIAGMREGGWRRMVVPAALAYGEAGLRKTGRAPGGFSNKSDKAGFAVKPGQDVFFDIRLVDGGSGRCEELLRPAGISEEEAGRRKSLSCMPNDLRVDRFSPPQTRF